MSIVDGNELVAGLESEIERLNAEVIKYQALVEKWAVAYNQLKDVLDETKQIRDNYKTLLKGSDK